MLSRTASAFGTDQETVGNHSKKGEGKNWGWALTWVEEFRTGSSSDRIQVAIYGLQGKQDDDRARVLALRVEEYRTGSGSDRVQLAI